MTTISTELQTTGVAEVIVVVDQKRMAAASSRRSVMRKLESHFVDSELSQRAAILQDGFVAAASPSRAPSAPVPQAALRGRSPAPTTASPPMRYFQHLGIAYGLVDRAGLAALRADPDVRSVRGAPPLRLIRPTKKLAATPNRKVTWGIGALGIPALWDQGLNGEGVVVAHLDTGVDGTHPALKDAIADFVEMDRLGFPVEGGTAFDTDDHGTHTAGTIAGRPDPRTSRQVGVAPGAMLVSAIVIEGGQTIARVLAGMDWALGNGAKVLSMSLGFPGFVSDFLPIIRILRQRGMLPVIAVGNEGAGTSRSPGNYAEALAVGWSNEDSTVDPESSSQQFRRPDQPIVPDLVGPGGDIVSAVPGGGYKMMSGTSMATPHIAGLAAILWQAEPEATINQIERAILESCTPLPGVPEARQGRGFPNGPRALQLLQGG